MTRQDGMLVFRTVAFLLRCTHVATVAAAKGLYLGLVFFLSFSFCPQAAAAVSSSREPQRQSVTAPHQKKASTHSTDTVDLVWGGLIFADGQKENSAWVEAPDDLLQQVVSFVFSTAPQSQVHLH